MPTLKLGDILKKSNLLQEGQLKAALAEQQKWGGRLGEILVRMRLLTEDVLIRALSHQLGVPAAALNTVQGVPAPVKAKIPAEKARALQAIPLQLRDDGRTLVVAMADPQNVSALDTLRAITRCRIVPQIAGKAAIGRAFARIYENEEELSDFEGSFKVVDAQGRTMVRSMKEVEAEAAAKAPAPPPAQKGDGQVASALEVLRTVEDVQRKEVSALKAMVQLLIDKGVFSREEYLAKIKR